MQNSLVRGKIRWKWKELFLTWHVYFRIVTLRGKLTIAFQISIIYIFFSGRLYVNENHCESCDCEAKNSNRDLFLQSVITDIVAVTVELSGIAYGVARGAFSYRILPQSSSLPPLSLGWQRHHNVRSWEHAQTRQLYRVFTRGDRRHDRPHVCLHEKTVGAIVGATDRSGRSLRRSLRVN